MLVRAGAVSRESTHIPPALRALLDETRDVLESRDFSRVLRLSLNRVFAELDEALRPAFGVPPPKPPGVPSMTMERFKELDEENEEEGKRVRLAALLPAVARQSQLILCAVPNTYAEVSVVWSTARLWQAVLMRSSVRPSRCCQRTGIGRSERAQGLVGHCVHRMGPVARRTRCSTVNGCYCMPRQRQQDARTIGR